MDFLKRNSRIALGAVLVLMAIWLWPEYQAQIPRTETEASQAAAIQIAQAPVQAPLTLIIQPDDARASIKGAIQEATRSLDLAIYELADRELEIDLADAHDRGLKVRVILENVNTFGNRPNQSAYDYLKSRGVPIKWAPKYFALTHQKTLIVDGETAYVMTFNLMAKYYSTSRDFGLINSDSEDVAAIKDAFESDWDGSRKTSSNGRSLIWSPGSAPVLLALIDSAQKTLDIYALLMDDPRIEEALKRASERGVKVRVVMSYQTDWKDNLNALTAAGVSARTYASTANLFIHAKAMIADGKIAYVGSQNFSIPSLDANRELGMIIAKPDILTSLTATFEKDWAGARPFGISADAAGGTVKKSKSGICHAPDSPSYNQTKNFTPFETLVLCLNSGGRLPANYAY